MSADHLTVTSALDLITDTSAAERLVVAGMLDVADGCVLCLTRKGWSALQQG